MKNNILITICARAGSQGFKNKNLKIFLGSPLVYYSLSAAEIFKNMVREDADIDICLNTDSDELSKIVKNKYPEVEYIQRDSSLAGSNVPKPDVWKNCIDEMKKRKFKVYDYMIDLDITSPLRQFDDVYNAFKLKCERKDADLVESMCHSRRNPYFNMMKKEGPYVNTVIECKYVARQQAPEVFDENASIYVLRANCFDDLEFTMDKAKVVPYIMKDTAVLDIDSEADFILMEVVGNYFYSKDGYKKVRDNIRC